MGITISLKSRPKLPPQLRLTGGCCGREEADLSSLHIPGESAVWPHVTTVFPWETCPQASSLCHRQGSLGEARAEDHEGGLPSHSVPMSSQPRAHCCPVCKPSPRAALTKERTPLLRPLVSVFKVPKYPNQLVCYPI